MVGFSVRAVDASGRRPRTQSGCDAARAGAGQCHLHRASVPPHDAGERRRLRGPGPAPPGRDRAILADLTESEGLLQTALDGGHLGALELHLPEFELDASDTCKAFFGHKPGEPFSYQDLLAAVHPEDRARRLELLNLAIATDSDYSIEYRNI